MCVPFKSSAFVSSSPLSLDTIPAGLHSQIWEVLCGAVTPRPSGWTSVANISLPFRKSTPWVQDLPCPSIHPSYSLDVAASLYL